MIKKGIKLLLKNHSYSTKTIGDFVFKRVFKEQYENKYGKIVPHPLGVCGHAAEVAFIKLYDGNDINNTKEAVKKYCQKIDLEYGILNEFSNKECEAAIGRLLDEFIPNIANWHLLKKLNIKKQQQAFMCEIGKLEMPVKMILDYVTDSRIIDLKSGKPWHEHDQQISLYNLIPRYKNYHACLLYGVPVPYLKTIVSHETNDLALQVIDRFAKIEQDLSQFKDCNELIHSVKFDDMCSEKFHSNIFKERGAKLWKTILKK